MLLVELLYVPNQQTARHLCLKVPVGSTVNDVLQQSTWLDIYPEIKEFSLGIFSKTVDGKTKVKTGDRIEIYRPLLIDPKEIRRQRAKN